MGLIVKICGLTSLNDIRRVIELGADYVGVICEPTSPRYVPLEIAETWLQQIEQPEKLVGVFGLEPPSEVANFHTVQATQRGRFAGTFWMVVRQSMVTGAEDPSKIVLDSGKAGVWGGTGHRVDTSWARNQIQASPVPVILAGGLNPENVYEAILELQPSGVDVSSGVEASPRNKDWDKVRTFIEQTRAAERILVEKMRER